jgi:hypothetical protein
MGPETPLHWGMDEMPPIEGDPFALARSSCLQAVQVARDVSIDEAALQGLQRSCRSGRYETS